MTSAPFRPAGAERAAPAPPPVPSAGLYAALLAAVAIWGTQFAVGKIAVTGIPPLTFAFARSLVAALVFVAAARAFGGGFRVRRRDVPGLVLVGVGGYALNQAGLFLGLRFAPASDGVLLGPPTNPVFTVLLAWLLGREAATRRQLAGMLLSGLGVAVELAAANLHGTVTGAPDRLAGDLLFLFSSLAWGVLSAFGRPYMARYGSLRTTTWAFALGSPAIGLCALVAGERVDAAMLTPANGLILLFMALFGGFLAFWLFNRGVAVAGAGVASRFSNLIPVFGLLASVWLLGERPSPAQVLGAVVIAAGVWVSTVGRGRRIVAPSAADGRRLPASAAGERTR